MKKDSPRLLSLAIANVIAFVAVIVVNYLAVSLPIGGMTTGALSDLYPNLFVPAGLTFSIWGLIYLMLGVFVVYQLVDLFRKQSKGFTQTMGIWFLLSCLANIAWIFAWHYQQVGLSVLIMLVFLGILILISRKLHIGQKIGSQIDKLCVQVPFSLYLGWLSVATIANISTFLVTLGWNARGISPVLWTSVVIVVATILGLLALYLKSDIIYAGVLLWAFVGIILKRISVDPVYASAIIWTLAICMSILRVGVGFRFEKWKKN